MSEKKNRVAPDPEAIKTRYETFLRLFEEQFMAGLDDKYRNSVFLSKELLHCAVKAYFDDIIRYKIYAGSDYADNHKQAAYTIKWLSRFRPIQLREDAEPDTVLITINESFALFAGFMFFNPILIQRISKKFYKHLIYTLTYRSISGKGLSTIMYLIEKCTKADDDI